MYIKKLLDLTLKSLPRYRNEFTSQLPAPISAVITGSAITLTYSQPLTEWFINEVVPNQTFITTYGCFFDIPFTNLTQKQTIYSKNVKNQEVVRIFFTADVSNPEDFKGFTDQCNGACIIKSADPSYNNQKIVIDNIVGNTLYMYIEPKEEPTNPITINNLLFNYNKHTSGINGLHYITALTTNSITYNLSENYNFNTNYNLYLNDIVVHYNHMILIGNDIDNDYLRNNDEKIALLIKPDAIRPQDRSTTLADNNSQFSSTQIQTMTQEINFIVKIPARKKYYENYTTNADIEIRYNEIAHFIPFLLAGVKFDVIDLYHRMSSGLTSSGASTLDYTDDGIGVGNITMLFNIETIRQVASMVEEDDELEKLVSIKQEFINQYV